MTPPSSASGGELDSPPKAGRPPEYYPPMADRNDTLKSRNDKREATRLRQDFGEAKEKIPTAREGGGDGVIRQEWL